MVLLLLVLAVLTSSASGVIFSVPANQEVCFGEELGEASKKKTKKKKERKEKKKKKKLLTSS